MAPFVSIVTPIYRPRIGHLKTCIKSVLSQTKNDWQLVLVDDASKDPKIDALLASYATDPRIIVHRRTENGGIVAASNDALNLAEGRLVAFLDNDDVLAKTAIAELAHYAKMYPKAEVFYSDRAHIKANGSKSKMPPFLKPDWSPERFRANMYLAHLTVVNREAAIAVGGFRKEYEGSQDHDLVLRIVERGKPVIHVPKVLYKWRETESSTASNADAKPYAREAGLRAVTDHCRRMGITCKPEHGKAPGWYVLNRTPDPGTKVSIVIPTRGSRGVIFGEERCLVVEAVRSVVRHAYVAEYEFVVVYDADGDLKYLDDVVEVGNGRVRLVPFHGEFNFSTKVNVGALHATGNVILLLNDDVQAVSPNWLDHLTALALDPEVGTVGAKLLFENGLVQHGGIGVKGPWNVFNADRHAPNNGGYFGSLIADHEVVGVTAACLAIRTELYFELGGFCEDFPNSYNDVDFSFKALLEGYRNIAANSIELYHFESMTRDSAVSVQDHSSIFGRWRKVFMYDPYLRGISMPIKR